MLNIEFKPGKNPCIIHQGDPIHVATELAMAVSIIHQALGGHSGLAAELFKRSIQAAMSNDSPVWEATDGIVTIAVDREVMQNDTQSTE